ncbi:hypothetical protein C2845_PMPSC027509 [Panicum miliaceum]|uniref:Uncharacterized protein n=1 Tax=Panicum miliaceum TaxID=4540 RepID=A0A3L6PBI3_PANMI|nr:hypothetical protein C2845_PMPSC027509 [Panicum miliaceum]
MPGPSHKRKVRDESVDSSPRASKIKRHISPPPITRPGGQYEKHKKLSDQVAELTLEFKSMKDDYDTLRRGLGVKIEHLENKVEKHN